MRRIIISIVLTLIASSIHAAPITWTLENVTFADGGTATGSFAFDSVTDTYSGISITTQGGDAVAFPGLSYTELFTEALSTNLSLQTQTAYGGHGFGLKFDSALSDAGGIISIVTPDDVSVEINLGGPGTGFVRYIESGTVSAIPVPAAVWLFGSALVGLGYFRKRVPYAP